MRLALGEGIAQHEDPRTGIGEGHLSDLLVAKAEAVGDELIGVAAPVVTEGAIGLEGMMAHRVGHPAILLPGADADARRIAALRNQSRARNAARLKTMAASSSTSFIVRCRLRLLRAWARFVRVHRKLNCRIVFHGQLACAGMCRMRKLYSYGTRREVYSAFRKTRKGIPIPSLHAEDGLHAYPDDRATETYSSAAGGGLARGFFCLPPLRSSWLLR